ncbi:hypothetical protein Misp01_18040 [Microtetraspora sp. NBRC 13810]|uniref:DoxX family protein n=1 Tax=Microtetraspora sp. NBRC 13810 TaxID=3030990 RepID=UPI00249FF94E|nr:DoxX family protein [Microtetraspora sp. NBRC 13810]GLW06674.1 hypothetical protein Misp01_18040 [Microtetraspora sp. NBRC 13810]
MNIVLWILQVLLAVAFAASGLIKVIKPKQELHARTPYVEDFSDGTVKAIGAIEVAAALGLILPAVTGIAPVLTPLAAAGLVLVMIGAAAVHIRRKEYPGLVVNFVLLVLAAVVAWGRFGPYPF